MPAAKAADRSSKSDLVENDDIDMLDASSVNVRIPRKRGQVVEQRTD